MSDGVDRVTMTCGDKSVTLTSDEFQKACEEIPGMVEEIAKGRRRGMDTGQMVMNEAGELVEEAAAKLALHETTIKAHSVMFEKGLKLDDEVELTIRAHVVETGDKLDSEGFKTPFQKLKITSVESVLC